MKLLNLFVCIFLLIPGMELIAQTAPSSDSASSTAAGTKPFRTNGSRTFWMGSNYRKEWNTKVTAPVINLATEYGGLKPVKRGGGKQTKSLRMEDPNGREYSLRSVQKFITSKTLPGDLQSEAAADLVADGVSASYPYSTLSIGVISDAAGIPNGKVRLVYIGDDPQLGEYRKDFSNMLALLEIRLPDSTKKGFDTDDVVEKLKEDNDNEVDQVAMLRARILDMYVMDLDRHEDQWQWGAIDKDKGKLYYPVPRDRDQAFYTNQGLLPGIVAWPWLVPQLQGFKPHAKNINRFNFAARNLDRFFLTGLDEQTWKTQVEKFLAAMTDDVLEKALEQQPPEIKPISAPKILEILKERRKYLEGEVMEYYRFLAEDVNITASDKKELFNITFNDDGSVLLQVFKITKEGEVSHKMYERKFDPRDTKELRIYGFGGDDKFELKGKEDKIKVRMIGGAGADTFENATNSGKTGIVYDLKSENNTVKGELKNRMSHDTMANYYNRLDYKYNNALPLIIAGYNTDDGVFMGALLKMIRHGFRKEPYKNSHTIAFAHAFSSEASRFKYTGEFISTFGRGTDLLVDIDFRGPNTTTNFFGYGMNSEFDKSKPGGFKYYRARYRTGDVSAMARTNISRAVKLYYGPVYQFFKLKEDDKFNSQRFITQTGDNGLDPNTLFTYQTYLGGRVALDIDTRDHEIIPSKGIHWNTQVRHLSGLGNTPYRVTQLNSDFTIILPIIKERLQLAERFGAGHNFGTFEFFQAQYLGTEDNLRGFHKYRFAGHSKMYNNFELRLSVANFRTYLFPAAIGILGFYDVGRVWADNDNSNKWASGYGVGIWFAPLRRILLTVTYTASKESQIPIVGLGWKF